MHLLELRTITAIGHSTDKRYIILTDNERYAAVKADKLLDAISNSRVKQLRNTIIAPKDSYFSLDTHTNTWRVITYSFPK